MQINLFEFLAPKYIIGENGKNIKLIEFFAGYGSQHLGFKYLDLPVQSHKIVEWAWKSIKAYKNLHHFEEHTDFYKQHGISETELFEFLFEKGVSNDYNKPMTLVEIKRKGFKWAKETYNNIHITNNLVNIMQVKGKDLEIVDKDKNDYVLSYSFPCQDLSLAGLRKGMDTSQSEEGGTRSGLLWEVERILNELNDLDNGRGGHLPNILLMENVPQVIAAGNMENMEKWDHALQKLGYSSYIKNLIATDYSIPQTRNRTFMVSILGDYFYDFPTPTKLDVFVKNLLEPVVDEKYFLSDKQIKDIENWKAYQKPLENIVHDNDVVPTITTRSGAYASGMILYGGENNNIDNVKEYVNYLSIKDDKGRHNTQDHRVYHKDLVGTIPATERGIPKILIPEATTKGYAEAEEGDGVYINRPHQKRGTVQKGKVQTLKTNVSDIGVVVEDTRTDGEKFTDLLIENNLVNEGDIIKWTRNAKILAGEKNIVEMEGEKGVMPTITTRHDALGIVVTDKVVGKYDFSSSENYIKGRNRLLIEPIEVFETLLTSPKKGIVLENQESKKLRIRKLTPKECGRFMGIKDEDIDKIMFEQSEMSSYHLFGDSIVTTVLMAIFSGLTDNQELWLEKTKWLERQK